MDSKKPTSGEMNRRDLFLSLAAAPLVAGAGKAHATSLGRASPEIELDGVWRQTLDRNDEGLVSRWFSRPLEDRMALPGGLERSKIGNPVSVNTPWTGDIYDRSFFDAPEYERYRQADDFKVPFFLQPDTWYRGAAWFQRDVDVPQSWAGKRVELFLERPHWETRVWIDGESQGRNEALHVPHVYDLGMLAPGRHRISIRVDNRMIVEIGHNGHGVTDHTQGNWNGIAGRIELRATEPVWIADVQLYPTLRDRRLRIAGRIGNASGRAGASTARVEFAGTAHTVPVRWQSDGGTFETTIQVDAANLSALRTWDEFDPVLHAVTVTLANGARWRGRFGWREMVGASDGFKLNGRPLFLRGALDCAIFPLTGHPPTDLESWRRVMRRVREYGLNHLRFHSYCPPSAAFEAADEAGVYIQVETVWANQSTALGVGLPVDKWIYDETDRILAAHGNHPSLVLMTHGNEPGDGSTPEGIASRDAFLAAYVLHYIAKDPRRLWTSGSGWPEIDENQYHVTPSPRLQGWGEGLNSRINAKPPETVIDYRDFVSRRRVPVVSHEIGQWCVYPDLNEIRKYTGYLKARNFEIFGDRLRDSGLYDLAPKFLHASGRLQVLCYKEDIESALRTHGMGGFQLLGLQDFPGQGTALVGVLDPFWDDKGYITGPEYRRFCSTIVPLARLKSRVCTSGEALEFTIDVAHFGAEPIADAVINWRIVTDAGHSLASGRFDLAELPLGNAPLDLGAAPTLSVSKASSAKLVVDIAAKGQSIAENDWDVWVYPAPVQPGSTSAVRLADTLNQDVFDHLAAGEKVLLGVGGEKIVNHADRPVKLGFSSIFWNTLWTQRQAPTTLGVLCDPNHPALRNFPTEPHSNWQWWYPLHGAGALRLDLLPPGVEPIVRVIDDWFTARPLGLIVELAVGPGKLILCGFPINGPTAQNPVCRQMVESLLHYMDGDQFKPHVQTTVEQLRSMVTD